MLALLQLSPEWQSRQQVSLERHLHRVATYSEALENLARHGGAHFKPSAAKAQTSLEFAPVNMHLQRLWVHNTTSRKSQLEIFLLGVKTYRVYCCLCKFEYEYNL